MKFYLIRNEKAPWGDYGNILLYGFISKENDQVVVERVAPFLPAVYSYNKYIAFTNSAKNHIQHFNFNNVSFVRAEKAKIINIDWQNWDFNDQIPHKPKSGEPEDFILKGKHSSELATQMEDIFVIIPIETAKGIIDNSKKVAGEYHHISLGLTNYNNADVFRTPQLGHIFCTEKFKSTIEKISDSYLRFIPINVFQ